MSAAAEKDTVWIGFMDIVPVIGTVKEAVELVLALYEGNEAVIKEKEKAVENIVKESLNKDVKKSTVHDKPAAAPAADADEYSGLRNVREVSKEKIIEYVGKVSTKGTKPLTPAQQKERQKKVEEIKKDMLEKIRIIHPNYSQELKEPLGRSQRGEHVFNNNILRFHSDVLKEFIKEKLISELQGYNQHQQAVDELGKHKLSQNTAEEIQTNMVVHFGEHEFYMNANGVVYGIFCSALREAMLVVLRNINPDEVPKADKQRVIFVIENMINLQIYVDQLAKVKWVARQKSTREAQTQFDNVRQEVAGMYRTKRGVDWCIDILHLVAPLFNTTGGRYR